MTQGTPPRTLRGAVDTHRYLCILKMIALILTGTRIGGCATMRDDALMRPTDRAADYPATIVAATPAVNDRMASSGKTDAALRAAADVLAAIAVYDQHARLFTVRGRGCACNLRGEYQACDKKLFHDGIPR